MIFPGTTSPDGTTTVLADLEALAEEVGASYPLLGYVFHDDEESDELSALDRMILAGLISPAG